MILDRLEIEIAKHSGKGNGKLIVTFAQFEEYGLYRKTIPPALRELIALGFIEITEQGRGGNAEWRRPSKYRLTSRNTDDAPATHEWRQITDDDAAMIAAGARRPDPNSPGRKGFQKPGVESVPKPGVESVPNFGGGKCTEAPDFPGGGKCTTI
jgi:hypothetical protein